MHSQLRLVNGSVHTRAIVWIQVYQMKNAVYLHESVVRGHYIYKRV